MRPLHRPLQLAAAVTTASLLVVAAPAGAKTVPRGVNYGGSNSQDDPVVVLLSKDGKKVTTIGEQFEAKCTSGTRLVRMLKVPAALPVSAAGKFSGARTGAGQVSDGSQTLSVTTIKGTVTGRVMTGTLAVNIQVVGPKGTAADTCSETATFKAAAKRGSVFAGFTSQDGPAVLELAAGAKKLHHLHVGWQSNCKPSGFLQIGDTLANFPIRNGVFGDDFTANYGEPGAEQETVTYSVHGKIIGPKASGRFQVKLHETDPDGSTADCDTGTVTFKAATG